MNAVFESVFISSLYGGIVGVILLFFKRLLSCKISAWWQLALWAVLMVKLLIPSGPSSELSLFNLLPRNVSEATDAHSPEDPIFSKDIVFDLISPDDKLARAAANEKAISASDIPSLSSQLPSKTSIAPFAILSYMWLSGVCILLVWFLFCSLFLWRKINMSSLSVNSRIMDIYQQCTDVMGLRHIPRVILQEAVKTPSLFALPSPIILLNGRINDMDDVSIGYILLHELSHYKRRDFIFNILLVIMQSMHWFNPIIWYCFARIREDIEQANDEAVLRYIPSAEHMRYAGALVSVLEKVSPLPLPLLSAARNKKNLERRINMIKLNGAHAQKKWIISALCIVLILALSTLLLTSAIAEAENNTVNLDGALVADTLADTGVLIDIGGDANEDDTAPQPEEHKDSTQEENEYLWPVMTDYQNVIDDGFGLAGENLRNFAIYDDKGVFQGYNAEVFPSGYPDRNDELFKDLQDDAYFQIFPNDGSRDGAARFQYFHNGVDIHAPIGAPIVAVDAGVVVEINENNSDYGFIRLDHGDGWCTEYSNICYAKGMTTGNTINKGEIIGYFLGYELETLKVDREFHFSTSRYGEYINPMTKLKICRLLGTTANGTNVTFSFEVEPTTGNVTEIYDVRVLDTGEEIKDPDLLFEIFEYNNLFASSYLEWVATQFVHPDSRKIPENYST
ncbi:MAG: peptidoglycan DD-metalloendopeptidase family protein [Oscillospiraceae bacterium]|nr:peptidoglycan DD-metalloendopeptidase family protein [Oscillospiraceae bacterium]